MARAKRKCVFKHAQSPQIKIHPTHAQSHPGIYFLLIHSIVYVSNDSADSDGSSQSTQADLGIRFPQMPVYTFLYGETHINHGIHFVYCGEIVEM